MSTMKELIKKYNNLVDKHFDKCPNTKKVTKGFASLELGLSAIHGLEERIKQLNKPTIRITITLKDLTPKGNTVPVQNENTLVTREDAIKACYKLYWNGKPCSYGHIAPRYTKSGHCKKCYQLFRAGSIQQAHICKDKFEKSIKERKVLKV